MKYRYQQHRTHADIVLWTIAAIICVLAVLALIGFMA